MVHIKQVLCTNICIIKHVTKKEVMKRWYKPSNNFFLYPQGAHEPQLGNYWSRLREQIHENISKDLRESNIFMNFKHILWQVHETVLIQQAIF